MHEAHGSPLAFLRGPIDQVASDLRKNWRRAGQGIRRGLVRSDDELCPLEGYSLSVRQTRRVDRLRALANGNFAAVLPGDSVAGSVITSGISSTLSLYQSALVVRVLLTWFPSPPQFLAGPLSTICDPYLNLFRGLIPPIGGTIDISPILAFVVLDLASGSAGSLSAEMPAAAPDAKNAHTRRGQQ